MEITDQNFTQEVLNSGQTVLLDMWATWCQPCKALEPIVDEVASEYRGTIKVGKVDIGTYPSIAMTYGVVSAPTLLLFKNGRPVSSLVGVQPKQIIKNELNKYL